MVYCCVARLLASSCIIGEQKQFEKNYNTAPAHSSIIDFLNKDQETNRRNIFKL